MKKANILAALSLVLSLAFASAPGICPAQPVSGPDYERSMKAYELNEKGREALLSNDYDTALRSFREAYKLDPKEVYRQNEIMALTAEAIARGNRSLGLKDYEGAIAAYEDALKADAASKVAADNLRKTQAVRALLQGNRLWEEEKYEEAARSYEETLRFDPGNKSAAENLKKARRIAEEKKGREGAGAKPEQAARDTVPVSLKKPPPPPVRQETPAAAAPPPTLPAAGQLASRGDPARDEEREREYRQRPRNYLPAGTALIGSETWLRGFSAPPGEEGQKLKAKADLLWRSQMKQAGVKEGEFMDPRDEMWLLAIASAPDALSKLKGRMIRGEWPDPFERDLYAKIRNREFERLECHSSGAMLCLAALDLGDTRARVVRLFGPEISPEAVVLWQRLIESGKVGTVELYIQRGDPVPGFSYLSAGAPPGQLYFEDALKLELLKKAPRISVILLDCPDQRKYLDPRCHAMRLYQIP